MATKQGYNYYTKEEIDELLADKITLTTYTDDTGSPYYGSRTTLVYSDGTMVSTIKVPISSVAVTTAWGSIFRGSLSDGPAAINLAAVSAPDFIAEPVVAFDFRPSGTSASFLGYNGGNPVAYATRWRVYMQRVSVFRATSATISGTLDITATGKWE